MTTTPDTAGLPCPFCGHVGVNVHEASTFRWVLAECNGCGAQGPEARRNTMESWPNEPVDTAKALAEWNTRAAQAVQPTVADHFANVNKMVERKPLSDVEVWQNDEIMAINADANFGMPRLMDFVRAVEAAHRIGEPS